MPTIPGSNDLMAACLKYHGARQAHGELVRTIEAHEQQLGIARLSELGIADGINVAARVRRNLANDGIFDYQDAEAWLNTTAGAAYWVSYCQERWPEHAKNLVAVKANPKLQLVPPR